MIEKNKLIEIASSVDPIKFLNFCLERNWVKIKNKSLDWSILEKKIGEQLYQVIIPANNIDLRDFNERILDAAKIVAITENKKIISVLNDVIFPVSDTIRLSVKSIDTTNGTIQYDDGLELLNNFRKMMTTAALAINNPKTYYAREYNVESDEFIKTCRLGQTEVGSYVATILCPVNNAHQQDLNGKIITDFGRKITINMLNFVKFLKKSTIEEAISPREGEPIISANFCDAIVDLRPTSTQFDLQIDVSWANGIEPQNVSSNISISNEDIPKIFAIGEKLKPKELEKRKTFTGHVIILKGSYMEKKMQGDIVFLTHDEDYGSIRAKITLDAVHYREASNVHTNHDSIIISGILVKESARSYRIKQYSRFERIKTEKINQL